MKQKNLTPIILDAQARFKAATGLEANTVIMHPDTLNKILKAPERYRLESDLQDRVITLLNQLRRKSDHALWFYKVHDACTAGIPDILGMYHGVPFACELKRPGEVPEPLQLKTLTDINQAGGVAFSAASIAEFQRGMNKVTKNILQSKNRQLYIQTKRGQKRG